MTLLSSSFRWYYNAGRGGENKELRKNKANGWTGGIIAIIVLIAFVILIIPMIPSLPELPHGLFDWIPELWPSGGGPSTTTVPGSTVFTTTYTTKGTTITSTTTSKGATVISGIALRPYKYTVVYDDGSEETVPYNWPWLYIPGDGGGKMIVALKNVQFQFYGTIQVNGKEVDGQVRVAYTIDVKGEGQTIASDSGSLTFASGQTKITDSALSISHTKFRSRMGDGYHKVTYRCTATAYMIYKGDEIKNDFSRKVAMDLVLTVDGMTVTVG